MSLGYYSPTVSGPVAKYSGDISSWTWTQSGQGAKSYGFAYDGAHRLTGGQYYSGSTATNALSEKGISYDRNGNITALTRYNSSGTATALAYAYTGNYRNTFSYDANGNVTSDATNSLQSSYNLLNLPSQIKSGSTVKANYTYLSDGTKAAAYTSASAGKDYVGSFTYTRGSGGSRTLESVAFGGGRIRKSGSSYLVDYHVTDHLGSVRAIVTNGSITEQNDYYPFGTRHSNGLAQFSDNRWRFSGKEEQDAFGIAYSDFGARFYDRSAWSSIDPMSEKYYSVSPYAYCNNNPVKFVDPSGKNPFVLGGAAAAAFDFAAISLGVITTGIILKESADGHIRFKNWSPEGDWQGRQDRRSEDETRRIMLKHQQNMNNNLPDPNSPTPKYGKGAFMLALLDLLYNSQPDPIKKEIVKWISGERSKNHDQDEEQPEKIPDEEESDEVVHSTTYTEFYEP